MSSLLHVAASLRIVLNLKRNTPARIRANMCNYKRVMSDK